MTTETPQPASASASVSPSQTMASARHKVLLDSRMRRCKAKMDNVSAHDLSQILRKASLLWAIPANKELLKSAFSQASRTAKHRMTRYEFRRHINSCVLPEPLSHEEVGLLMTWIEPIKEKTIDFDTVEAKLAVLLEGLRTYSEKRSLLGYFNEKFQFNDMLATAQKAPNSVGSFTTRPEVPPSSMSESKIPITYSPSLKSPTSLYASPLNKNKKLNSKTIANLKEGIGELGKKIETMRKEQKNTNPFLSSRVKSGNSMFASNTTSLVSPLREDALSVLKQEFQQIGEKVDKIRRQNDRLQFGFPQQPTPSVAAMSSPTPAKAEAQEAGASSAQAQGTEVGARSPAAPPEPIPTDPKSMQAELVRLRKTLEEEKRAKADNAAELQATRAMHEASMKDINSKLQNLESLVSEKTTEVGTLKVALSRAKDDALTAVESEKQHTDDLIKREERLLNTLMKQLNKAQNEQVQLDEYAEEIDKVYDSLEKLYTSLKSESRPLSIAPPPPEEETRVQHQPSALVAHQLNTVARSTGNPFATSPLEPELPPALEVEPDVKQQLSSLKSELHALLRVLE
ncbi:hypothetical protein HOP50_06g41620 [Chloropicon primus]|uniref:Uncharacterized protein n=1 Tax=Chloropicon primus TaxID=1764295 RepID=A0A5B8MPV7_9CHLO|nr:hypothetical protein A3770_06p41530 [Chloropicon primus]UPR00846.1 hypothetical protein HOP50_06g41620 [Chloropicon primus]|eukprot:QDZ21635.1 hypothetical protein A3770_06p41530 [Chloropicon primus]